MTDLSSRPTISQLARSLGVSPATVSNVLNGKGSVSGATRQRVLQAASQSGYAPSHAARALRTGRTHMLGLIIPNITNPVFPLMAQAVGREAAERGQAVVLMDSQDDPARQAQALASLASRSVDATILVACRGTQARDIPDGVVLIDAPSNPRSDVSSDHFLGGQLAARHLLGLGHTRLAVLAGPTTSLVAGERYGGARAVLAEAGLEFVHVHHSSYGLEHGEAYIREHFQQHFLPGGCSAVYAVSDSLAVGVIRGLLERGARVPQDVSVMGFDDVVWAALVTPALSTIRQDATTIGQLAVRRALGEQPIPRAVPVTLVPRASTGPPSASANCAPSPPARQRRTP